MAFAEVVEVREITRRDVNAYLEHGYELLSIQVLPRL